MPDKAVLVIRKELAAARHRVAALEGALAALGGAATRLATANVGARRGRRKMTAAQKKAVSERMRKYWAARKRGR